MTNLVERLRFLSSGQDDPHSAALTEAADKIEQQEREIKRLRAEVAFYKRRVQAMGRWQSRMRDPERTVVCDIIANGFTLDPPVPRDRYEVKPAEIERLRAELAAERERWVEAVMAELDGNGQARAIVAYATGA